MRVCACVRAFVWWWWRGGWGGAGNGKQTARSRSREGKKKICIHTLFGAARFFSLCFFGFGLDIFSSRFSFVFSPFSFAMASSSVRGGFASTSGTLDAHFSQRETTKGGLDDEGRRPDPAFALSLVTGRSQAKKKKLLPSPPLFLLRMKLAPSFSMLLLHSESGILFRIEPRELERPNWLWRTMQAFCGDDDDDDEEENASEKSGRAFDCLLVRSSISRFTLPLSLSPSLPPSISFLSN